MIGVVVSINAAAVRERLHNAVPARTIGGILVALALLTFGQDGGGAIATALETGSHAEPIARHVWTVDLTAVAYVRLGFFVRGARGETQPTTAG